MHARCFILKLPPAHPLLFVAEIILPYNSGEYRISAFDLTCMTNAVSVGIPHANPLAYWVGGPSFCVHNSTIHSFTLYNDHTGCLHALLPLLNQLFNTFSRTLFWSSNWPGPFTTEIYGNLANKAGSLALIIIIQHHTPFVTFALSYCSLLRYPTFLLSLFIAFASFNRQ